MRHIREHGFCAQYGGRYYVYLVVDGWKYWSMGAPVGATTIINRARVSDGEGSQDFRHA